MNFSLTVWEWFIAGFYVIFVASSGISPALVIVGYLMRSDLLIGLGNATGGPMPSFVIGTAVNLLFGFLLLTGTKRVLRFLTVTFVLALAGLLTSIASLASSNITDFINRFNQFATGWVSSGDPYHYAITTATHAGFSTAPNQNWGLLIPMLAVASSELIWCFWSTYVAGEIRESKSMKGQAFTMVGSTAFNGTLLIVAIFLIVSVMGYDFLAATTFLGSSGSGEFPFVSQVTPGNQLVIFISLLANSRTIAILLPILFVGWSLIILPVLFLQPSRCVFSWAIDRIAPEKFAQVVEKYHTPIYTPILGIVTCEICIVILTVFPSYAYTIFAAGVIAPAFASMLPTAFSAIFLPRRRKELYRLSGLYGRRFLGLPVIVITGSISAGYLIFLTLLFFSYPAFGLHSPIMMLASFGPILLGGMIYCVAKAYRKRQGFDLDMTFVNIPPE